jgi:hypothetical protein
VLLLFHLRLGRHADLDDRAAAGQLREPLPRAVPSAILQLAGSSPGRALCRRAPGRLTGAQQRPRQENRGLW